MLAGDDAPSAYLEVIDYVEELAAAAPQAADIDGLFDFSFAMGKLAGS
ncbi:MAG TPA: hypothetical protein VFQ44_27585 [Streptosporangiaceae bacterium]|nr:hypothetical protein [Streptosporangiaceae bacterium]